MPGPWRSYTEVERGEAVGLAMTIGTKAASAKLGIPRRTLSSWIQRPTAEVQGAIVATRDAVAGRLWEVIELGTDVMKRRLGDPKTRAGEVAQIVRTAMESHALITGGPTSRTEATVTNGYGIANLSEDEYRNAREFVRLVENATDDEIREYLASDKGIADLGGLRAEVPAVEARNVG